MTPENALIAAAQDFALERDEEAVVDAYAKLKAAALAYARPIVADECAMIIKNKSLYMRSQDITNESVEWLMTVIREHGRSK